MEKRYVLKDIQTNTYVDYYRAYFYREAIVGNIRNMVYTSYEDALEQLQNVNMRNNILDDISGLKYIVIEEVFILTED